MQALRRSISKIEKIIPLAAAVLLAGCTFGGSVDLLLSPPKLSEEQNSVYNARVKSVGNDIRLQYPRAGEYRSAFVFANIDSEPDDEAIVFYEKSGETEGAGNVRINIIDRLDGEWVSVYDHAGAGTGIDRILFSDMGSGGIANMIIGYTLLSGEKSASVYSYDDGRLFTDYSDIYSTMFVTDITRDGGDELVLIRPTSQLKKAALTLISRNTEDGSAAEISTVALDENASDFVNIVYGYVSADMPAIFIDGLSGRQLTTEVVYSVNDMLRNPLYLGESSLIENTRRQSGYLSTDIDLDGIIEIPTRTPFPGYSIEERNGQESRNAVFSTDWNAFDNYSIVKKYSSYYNAADGYCFIMPSRWDGVVTVKIDSATGDAVFYKFRIDLENSTTELMRIAAVGDSQKDALLEDGYMQIKSNNNINYLVKCPDIENEPLMLTGTEISNNFYVMA
ncbi:MAG: hypothetical protein K2H23_03135 [Oscillospiraceae bacterium]|nr:hypothetical protein [Oscillospiraceae bacterium]